MRILILSTPHHTIPILLPARLHAKERLASDTEEDEKGSKTSKASLC